MDFAGAYTLIPAPGWRESAEAGRCTLASVLAWYISTRVAPCTLLSVLDCYVFAAHRTQRRPAHKHKAKNKVCELDHVEIWEHRVCPRARNSNHHRTYGWCGPAEGPTVPEPSAACGIFKFNFFMVRRPSGLQPLGRRQADDVQMIVSYEFFLFRVSFF